MLSQKDLERRLDDWPLSWISHETLLNIVSSLISEASPKTDGLNLKNGVDPFSAVFDMSINSMSYDEWIRTEIRRQHQKTMQNAIGKLHQTILGNVKGWRDLGVGNVVDLVNDERKLFAEVKNKFNTVKGSEKITVYNTLAEWRGMYPEHRDYTGFFVQIITKDRFNRPFTPSDNKKRIRATASKNIREIDGESFYELVTGEKTALRDLYYILPYVLQEAIPTFDSEGLVKDRNYIELFDKTFPKE